MYCSTSEYDQKGQRIMVDCCFGCLLLPAWIQFNFKLYSKPHLLNNSTHLLLLCIWHCTHLYSNSDHTNKYAISDDYMKRANSFTSSSDEDINEIVFFLFLLLKTLHRFLSIIWNFENMLECSQNSIHKLYHDFQLNCQIQNNVTFKFIHFNNVKCSNKRIILVYEFLAEHLKHNEHWTTLTMATQTHKLSVSDAFDLFAIVCISTISHFSMTEVDSMKL